MGEIVPTRSGISSRLVGWTAPATRSLQFAHARGLWQDRGTMPVVHPRCAKAGAECLARTPIEPWISGE